VSGNNKRHFRHYLEAKLGMRKDKGDQYLNDIALDDIVKLERRWSFYQFPRYQFLPDPIAVLVELIRKSGELIGGQDRRNRHTLF
jgi:hypothetical protein